MKMMMTIMLIAMMMMMMMMTMLELTHNRERRRVLKKGKNPFRKRVTLGSIPARLTRMESESGREGERTVNIVPPAVTISGCTPPSEQDSVDGELEKYFKGVS